MRPDPYVPPNGLSGRLVRLKSRLLARRPIVTRPTEPIVSISFDDFARSAATTASEAIEKRGWRATFFASGGMVGETTHLGPMFERDDLLRLHCSGHEIACHTYSHLDAARTGLASLLQDVDRNREAISEWGLDGRLESFAFPYGESCPSAKSALIERFRVLRGVRPGINRRGSDRSLLNAVGLDGGEAGIANACGFATEVARKPGWLIYFGHDVRDDPSPWGCTPAQFERVLDAIAASGAMVLPIDEAADRLGLPQSGEARPRRPFL